MKRTAEYIVGTVFFLAVFMLVFAYAGEDTKKDTTEGKIGFDQEQPVGTKAQDPVSGQVCFVSKNTPRAQVEGKHYYFCCPGCKEVFEIEPESFLDKQAKQKADS